MYSAFSERSPSAAAAASALTTSGRFTRQSSSSSAFSRAWPSRVISAVLFSAGGRQRLTPARRASRRAYATQRLAAFGLGDFVFRHHRVAAVRLGLVVGIQQ